MLPPNPWLLNWCHPPSISLVSILGLIPVSFLALVRVSALSLANVLCLPKSAFPTRDLGFKLVSPTLFSPCFRFGSNPCFRSRPSPCFRPMVGPRSVPPQSAFPTRELVLNWCHSPSLVLVSVPALILVSVPALVRLSVPSLAHVLCLPQSASPTRDLGFNLVSPTLFGLRSRLGSNPCSRSRLNPCFRPIIGPPSVRSAVRVPDPRLWF